MRFASLALALATLLPACRDTRGRGRNDAGIVRFDAGPGFDAGVAEIAPLRIAGGGSMGRLEIQHDGVWGTICDDGFDELDATVACRQLGYSSGTAYTDGMGVDPIPIWLDDLACVGTEAALSICAHSGWGIENCSHGEDVGVTCL